MNLTILLDDSKPSQVDHENQPSYLFWKLYGVNIALWLLTLFSSQPSISGHLVLIVGVCVNFAIQSSRPETSALGSTMEGDL